MCGKTLTAWRGSCKGVDAVTVRLESPAGIVNVELRRKA
jgi:hypothetical protein